MDRLERAKIRFQVVTPIFIGNGEDYTQEEYWITGGTLHLLRQDQVVEMAEKVGLYRELLTSAEDFHQLQNFYRRLFQRVPVEKVSWRKIGGDPRILEELQRNSTRGVQQFIKDSFWGTPIIPGSSLKGAIRTALLSYLVQKFGLPSLVVQEENFKKRARKLEGFYFCGSNKGRFIPQQDILKALSISDLKPLSFETRVINPTNRPYRKPKDNKIPVVIEGLIRGEFEGEIGIDRGLIERDRNLAGNPYFQETPLSLQLIKDTLNQFYSTILERENNRFRVTPLQYSQFLVKIGRFGGAGSKSVEEYRQVFIRQLKKNLPYQLSIWIDTQGRPFGWGRLQFLPS
ncbi:MAG: type III-A CRISPR-associated RAMP protein Csm5 [Campylobacterales bacterium]